MLTDIQAGEIVDTVLQRALDAKREGREINVGDADQLRNAVKNQVNGYLSVAPADLPHVVCVVEGGVLQDVLADRSVRYLVKDWDEIKGGEGGAENLLYAVDRPEMWNDAENAGSLKKLQEAAADGVAEYQ